jgi:Trm5-related predicted tRNA methylase
MKALLQQAAAAISTMRQYLFFFCVSIFFFKALLRQAAAAISTVREYFFFLRQYFFP